MASKVINDLTLKTESETTDEMILQQTGGGAYRKALMDPLTLDSTNNIAKIYGELRHYSGNQYLSTQLSGITGFIQPKTTSGQNALLDLSPIPNGGAAGSNIPRVYFFKSSSSSPNGLIQVYDPDGVGATVNTQIGYGGTNYATNQWHFGSSSAPVSSAQVQITSTTRGFRLPVMTTSQKTAIGSPVTGLIVYDSTLNELSFYNGSAWQKITGYAAG